MQKMKEEERIQSQNEDFLDSLAPNDSCVKNTGSDEPKTDDARDHDFKHAIILINEYYHDLNDTLRKSG